MKILFSDLDGTLLTDEKRILDVDMSAIQQMLDQGNKFLITTGRPLTSAKKMAQRYGFFKPGFYLVSFNGGLIYDCATEKSILTRTIPVESVKFIMDEAHACGMHAHTYAGDLVISEYETDQLKSYCEAMQMNYLVVDNVIEYFAGIQGPINVVVKPNPIKVNVITPFGHNSLEEFRVEMRKTTDGKLFDVFSKPEMLEFSNLKSNKGDAVRFMADFYNVPIKDTIACGDEENDCPMIEAAGLGVAMCNGSDAAKAKADYITEKDNNHGGIAEIIEKFVLTAS